MTRDLSGMQYARSYVSVYGVYGPRYEKSNNHDDVYRVHCRMGFGLPSVAEKLGDSANSVLGFDK